MRVLHVYAGNLYGGVEAMLATFARHADAAGGMEPRFALCFDGRLARELREAGNPPSILGAVRLRRPWTAIRARRALDRVLDEARPDVVACHSAWSHAVFAPVVRRRGLPLVFWLHDAVTGRTAVERMARRAGPDLAVCTSRYVETTLPRLFPHVRSAVVYPSVAPPPDPRSGRDDVRRALGTAAEDVVIVQASRMEPWKGHRVHLEALALLRDVPGWTCWLAGGAQRPHEARHRRELGAFAAERGIAGRVRFLGERADVPRLFAAADVHCQPNLGPEPFGIAYVEALYAGLPVIASDLGGAAEIVDDSCGARVPAGDARAVADALRRLVGDPDLRTRLGAAGPARARALCDPAAQAARLHGLLTDLAAGGRA
ncbi:MAG TPA: glycosyltransferase [Longimicrobium sp.]|nr:glycosyltransferase [Longimicrobium sp.]